jgi:urate oxidase
MKIHKIANDIASDHNMTPEQRSFSRDVQREAYQRLPETCDRVREILTEAQYDLMDELEIDPADYVTVDAILSIAFQKIRDEVTQNFRTEQMRLLDRK